MRVAHFAQAGECVTTTLLLPKLPMWLPAGTAQPMKAHHVMSQLTVTLRSSGIAQSAATDGWQELIIALDNSKLVALSAITSSVQGQKYGIPLWLSAIIRFLKTGTL